MFSAASNAEAKRTLLIGSTRRSAPPLCQQHGWRAGAYQAQQLHPPRIVARGCENVPGLAKIERVERIGAGEADYSSQHFGHDGGALEIGPIQGHDRGVVGAG